MTALVIMLLAAAGLSLGLRTTSFHEDRGPHPIDRLLVAFMAGIALVWVGLLLSWQWRVFEAGLGLIVSLAPVGLYDLARWWYRSGHPFEPWVIGARRPAWVLALRCLAGAGVALACAGAYVAMRGVLAPPPQ